MCVATWSKSQDGWITWGVCLSMSIYMFIYTHTFTHTYVWYIIYYIYTYIYIYTMYIYIYTHNYVYNVYVISWFKCNPAPTIHFLDPRDPRLSAAETTVEPGAWWKCLGFFPGKAGHKFWKRALNHQCVWYPYGLWNLDDRFKRFKHKFIFNKLFQPQMI